jgi:hypothetical protein
MMLLKSKDYPYGRFQILRLTGNHLNIKNSIMFKKHPTFFLGAYAKWSLRLMFIEIKEWLPDDHQIYPPKKRLGSEVKKLCPYYNGMCKLSVKVCFDGVRFNECSLYWKATTAENTNKTGATDTNLIKPLA